MSWVRMFAVLLLVAALLFSVTELFDTWDTTPQTGNDLEYNAVLVILCVGAVLACFRLLLLILTEHGFHVADSTSCLPVLLAVVITSLFFESTFCSLRI